MKSVNSTKFTLAGTMCIYGTIGIFVHYIPLPSAFTAMIRGFVGAAFLLLLLCIRGQMLSRRALKDNFPVLFVSGIMLGVDWILIFEAYRYASVSLATLFHYLAPVIIVAASPFVFKEKMTGKKLACIMAALLGMVFVSGVAEGGIPPLSQLKGILMAFCGAFLYATVVIANKKVHGISPYDRTLVQLAVSAIVLLIYNLLSGSFPAVRLSGLTIALLLILGCVHTGLAYCLYFSCAERLNAQTLAIYSYIDPVLALLLSALILKEDMSLLKLLGAVLVIAAALISELPEKRKSNAGI